MKADLAGLLNSLADLMDEESDLLAGGSWPPGNEALAAAKIRLTGALEARLAEQDRVAPNWLADVPPDGVLAAAIARMRDSALANANLLLRQIELSQEWLHEIAREVGRLSGNRQQTYQRGGYLARRDGPAPVTLNTRL